MRTETGASIRLADYKPAFFSINRTHLCFKLDPTTTRVIATLEIVPKTDGVPLILDGDGLKLINISINGAELDEAHYSATPNRLEIASVPEVPFTLIVETEVNPSANTALMGLYRTNNVYCTQCEAEGFRRMTYFLDRPDVLSVYTVRIEGDAQVNPLLLSNGNPTKQGDLGNGLHFAEWHDPHPKPAYLFALVAGDLEAVPDQFTTASGRKVALNIYVEHGNGHLANYAMDALKRSMKWDEDVFGLEYDLDLFNIVAVSDFNMGAMENKGLNVFNDKYVLADPKTATDQDYANIEAIIAHEYFHNWTGNRITCRDWFQLCLKEGLTVYRDHEFSADERSRPVKRIQEIRTLKAQQFPEDQGPLSHPVRPRRYKEINNFYTATVYEKGSEVVRMLRTLLGSEIFKKSLDLYFERHDGDAATIEQFLTCFAEVSSRDLSQFYLWYEQSGTPFLEISEAYDESAQRHQITIEQSTKPSHDQRQKNPMHLPVTFALMNEDGTEAQFSSVLGADVHGDVIELTERKHTITFDGVNSRPVASLLRGFSAPVMIKRVLNETDEYLLARKDTDPVNRWQAITSIYNNLLVSASAHARNGRKITISDIFCDMMRSVLNDPSLDDAFKALCLTLPTEGDIAREIGINIDPNAVHIARKEVQKCLCTALITDIVAQKSEPDANFAPDAASAGKRALNNRLLEMEAIARSDENILTNALAQANNMTDQMARLSALVLNFSESASADKAMKAFREEYDGNALVLDKWFMLLAAIPGDRALNRIKNAMADSAFDMKNPNRVRSLIGGFAGANPTGFHREDGKAYAFFAELILDIDTRNPQLSARLLTALRSWGSLEPKRKTKLRDALSTIAKGKALSGDLQEIVELMIG